MDNHCELASESGCANFVPDRSHKTAPSAGLPVLQSPSKRYPETGTKDAMKEIYNQEHGDCYRLNQKTSRGKPQPQTQLEGNSSPNQNSGSCTFSNYLDCFLSFVREKGLVRVPLKPDGIRVSVSSPNWSTLVYIASRSKTIQETPVGTILDFFAFIVPLLDDVIAIEDYILGDTNATNQLSDMLLKALNGVIVSLIVMSSDHVNRTVILDDILQKTVVLLKRLITCVIVPLFDETARHKTLKADLSSHLSFEQAFTACIRVAVDLMRRLNLFYSRENVPECHAMSIIDICCTLLRSSKDNELKNVAMCLLVTCFLQHESLREITIEEVSNMMVSEAKKSVGQYRIGSNLSVHFPVALALMLIQSLSSIPEGELRNEKNCSFQDRILLASEQTDACCKALVTALMNKSLKPGHSLSESRSCLQLAVEDIFACLFLPSWPSAETVLHTVFHALRSLLFKENVNHSRIVAVELLGHILAKLQNHIAAVDRDVSIMRPPTDVFDPSSSIHSNPDEKVGCECGLGASKSYLMLDCDECHFWFHGKCVDITDDAVPDSWICNSCELRHRIEQQRLVMDHLTKKKKRNTFPCDLSEDDLLFHVLLNFYNTNHLDFIVCLSKDYMLSLWFKRVHASDPAKARLYYSFFSNERFASANQDLEGTSRISRVQAYRIIRLLSRKYSLLRDSDMLLKAFINMLSDKQPVVRSRVVKGLSLLVESNVQILEHEYVSRAISVAVQDKSTSVREAAVEILGKKMLTSLSLSDKYYPVIASRIRDKGLSVRKRCVKILRDICIEFPDHPKYVDICTKLISRTLDEPSVRLLVQKSLHEFWFSKFLQPESRRMPSTGTFHPKFHDVADKIVDVVASLSALDWLSEIITNALDADSQLSSSNIFEVYGDLCSCIVQKMLSLSSASESLHHVRTLYVFCCARPSLLLEHFQCLQPMLKVDRAAQGPEQSRLSLLCSIFLMTLPHLENPRQRLLENLSGDLKELILQQSASVLLNAIPCLCVLASKIRCFLVPQQLLRSFFHYLCQHKTKSKFDGPIARSIIRSLISVGLLVRSMHLDADDKTLTFDNIIETYRSYFSSSNAVVRRTSMQGLFYCYFRMPSLLVSSYDLISAALSDVSDLELHAQVFHSFADFLQNEEDQLKYLQALKSGSELLLHGSRYTVIRRKDEETESGVIVSVVQKLFPACIQHAFSSSFEVRFGVLRLTQLLLKQRLINPAHCAPSLIALCSDNYEKIANLALAQISLISTSFPDMLRNSIIDGVRQIASYQFKINGSSTKFLENEYPLGMLRLFEIISRISHNTASIVAGILNLIDLKSNENFASVEFVTMLLSGLPLQNTEPLHLLYHLTRLIGVNGAAVEEQLTSVLKESPSDISVITKAYCIQARRIEILVNFKHFLTDTFNISEALIENWSPYQKSSVVCTKKDSSAHFAPNAACLRIPQTVEQLTSFQKNFKKMLNDDVCNGKMDYTSKNRTGRRKPVSPKVSMTPRRRRKSGLRRPIESEGETDSDFDDVVIVRPKRKRIISHKANADSADSSSLEVASSV